MRFRPPPLVVPVVLAGSFLLAAAGAPASALAPGGSTGTGGATHTVPPAAATTVGGQAFDIQGLAGDATWPATIQTGLGTDVQNLEDLTGLKMPGGTIVVAEVGDGGLVDGGLKYEPATQTLSIPQSATAGMVVHGLAHIWFNSTVFKDAWVYEGLAGYSQSAAGPGNYVPCVEAPAYPGPGSPDLGTWRVLNSNSTILDQNISDWQYAASCQFFTAAAGAMGADAFKGFLKAAVAGEPAYPGAAAGEGAVKAPITSRQLLDLIDEDGMVPGGVADLGKAQELLSGDGLFDKPTLAARLEARTAYRALAVGAGAWETPIGVRQAMSGWDFATAKTEISLAADILDLREAATKALPGFSTDGTTIQTQFESAATPADLTDLASLMKKVSTTAGKVATATKLQGGGHDFIQAVGLFGTDLDKPLHEAQADLKKLDLDDATAKADQVIDRVNGSTGLGLAWIAAAVAVTAFVALLIVLLIRLVILPIRRRRGTPASSS